MSAPSQPGDVAVVIAARNEADRIAATVAAAPGLAGGGGAVAVVIAARNEADRIAATVAAAAGLAGVGLVVVVDDGSQDATAAVAQRAGAAVMRHPANRGKGAAMETGAEAVRLVDQREDRDRPRHLLFLDAD